MPYFILQPDQDQNNNWQQPKESAPQAPYETVDESDYNEDLGDSRGKMMFKVKKRRRP